MADFSSQNIYKYLIITTLMAVTNANIYLRPVDTNDVENTLQDQSVEKNNEDKYMFVILPHRLLRSVLPESFAIEPYTSMNKTIKKAAKPNDTLEELKLTKEQKEMLRKSWRYSCDRKAAKICRKACISTYKIVCSGYLCKKGMKRSFKRECKRNCKGRFVNRRSDSE